MKPLATQTMRAMYDLFISHSSMDKAWVERLVRRLEAEQYQGRPLRIWFDKDQLHIGNCLRPSIEEAIKASRFLGVVLSPSSVNCRWVTHEWNYFFRINPDSSHILPLLHKKCDIPILIEDLLYVDFRDDNLFDEGVVKLLERPRTSDGKISLEIKKEVESLLQAAITSLETALRPTKESDALYTYLKNFDIHDLVEEGLVLTAFDTMLDCLAILSDRQAYDSTLLVAECLAALLVISATYSRLPQRWMERDHWTASLVIIRAYSKIAEIDASAVDTSALLHTASTLDTKSSKFKTLQTHIARAVGKMGDTPQGQKLINDLSNGNATERWVAVGAILMKPLNPGPIYFLSALKEADKRIVHEQKIPEQYVSIIRNLLRDPDSDVKRMAVIVANEQPELKPLLTAERRPIESNNRTREFRLFPKSGYLLPFSGLLLKATAENMSAYAKHNLTDTIVYISSHEVLESYFYGASGLLLYDQGMLTHLCVRLYGARVPFVLMESDIIDDIPEGSYLVVREGVVTVRVCGNGSWQQIRS
jgi:TIR domain